MILILPDTGWPCLKQSKNVNSWFRSFRHWKLSWKDAGAQDTFVPLNTKNRYWWKRGVCSEVIRSHWFGHWEQSYAELCRASWLSIDQSTPTIPLTSLNPGYNPAFAAWNVVTVKQSVANMALSVLADAVLRVATRLKAPVIDLRRVMNKALGADGDRWRTHASRVTLWIAVFQSCCAHAAILYECFNLMSTNVTAFKLDLDRLFFSLIHSRGGGLCKSYWTQQLGWRQDCCRDCQSGANASVWVTRTAVEKSLLHPFASSANIL